MNSRNLFAENLAAAMLAGEWEQKALWKRTAEANGRRGLWLRRLVNRALEVFPDPPVREPHRRLAAFILNEPSFVFSSDGVGPTANYRVFWETPAMAPSPWPVPSIATVKALAKWLGINTGTLDWFSDRHERNVEAATEQLHNYHYRWLAKSRGRFRLLEAPKPRLKAIQRKLLAEILDKLPPHEAAHGYRKGRSIATFARPHVGQRVVLRFDLKNFFPSIRASRIHAIFAAAGYPHAVARSLTGLCTNVVPAATLQSCPAWKDSEAEWLHVFRERHLPQGAPTSPALANLAAYRLDCRLQRLAESVNGTYTRYADDLAFSGDRDLERSVRKFRSLVYRIALEEGFEVQLRKSRVMRQGVRQRLVGLVVNEKLNRPREEFDRLKAILHNSIRSGPASQNREGRPDFRAHLMGLVAHWSMIHPDRGRRLKGMFDRIDWGEVTPQSPSAS